MPPVHRHHGPVPVAVPADLVNAVDWMFAVSDGDAGEFGLDDDEVATLARLALIPAGDSKAVTTTADVLAQARNVLDNWTQSSECEPTNLNTPVTADTPIGEVCAFCLWCQALVVRDWIDLVLDEAGCVSNNPYLEAVDRGAYDPEAIWRSFFQSQEA